MPRQRHKNYIFSLFSRSYFRARSCMCGPPFFQRKSSCLFASETTWTFQSFPHKSCQRRHPRVAQSPKNVEVSSSAGEDANSGRHINNSCRRSSKKIHRNSSSEATGRSARISSSAPDRAREGASLFSVLESGVAQHRSVDRRAARGRD